MSEKDP